MTISVVRHSWLRGLSIDQGGTVKSSWEANMSEKKAVQQEKMGTAKGLRYAAVGLILGAGVGFALGGPVTAGMGAGIGLVLGAGVDAALRRKETS